MPVLKLTLIPEAPLLFSDRRPDGQFRPSTAYIPGSAIRGSLAQELLNAGCDPNECAEFRALFLGAEAPLFRNAYPGRLLPATAFSCKSHPGWRDLDRPNLGGHGVYDSLLDRFCFESMQLGLPYLPRCPRDGDRVEAFSGFYSGPPERRKREAPPVRMLTRVALNRRRRSAETGLLYSPLAIEATGDPLRFVGSIVTSDDRLSVVKRWLGRLTHVGSGSTRGLGKVSLQVEEDGEPDVQTRVKAFTAALNERRSLCEQFGQRQPFRSGFYFSLTLQSDAILRVETGLATLRLEPGFLGEVGHGAELVRCYSAAETRGGWNLAWGLPKDTELAVRAGSVFLYYMPEALEFSNWLEALRALEENGVGERRQEGYGQVLACDPFHFQGLMGRTAERR